MGNTYGYCRISTPQQSIDRQIRNISQEYPAAHIIQEAYTGTKIHRPAWDRLVKAVKPGDTIVFDSVSRMSRNADEGCKAYMDLYTKGIDLVFLKEHHIDTATYKEAADRQISVATTGDSNTDELIQSIAAAVNRYMERLAMNQIRLAFDQAEKEVQDLRQRTREGMLTAKLEGKQIGLEAGAKLTTQKGEAVKKVIAKHSKDFGGSLADGDCMKLAGCARNTFYKHKGTLRNLYSCWVNESNDPGTEEWRENLTPAEAEIVAAWDDSCPL